MSAKNQFSLLTTSRFLPLFLTQFLGAFNDNFFKSALMMFITFRLADESGSDPRVMVNVAAGAFVLPFFLFAAPAGDLADRCDRAFLMRQVKLAEIFIMAGAAVGFYLGDIWLLIVVLFLMGAQSAFFSPAKYSILPQHLAQDELIAGNGLIQMGTYLAILSGAILGGVLILRQGGIYVVGGTAVLIAAAGWVSSWFIPPTQPIDPTRRISLRFLRRTWEMVQNIVSMREVVVPMLAISWFWLVGATFLAQFPTYARLVLGANENVATSFLAIFSLGIGIGSTACNALLRGRVTARFVPAAAFGIAAASVLLWMFSDRPPMPPGTSLMGLGAFLKNPANWPIPLCLLLIAFCGGLYIVPLYAVIQSRAPEGCVARVIACSNISDSIFMTVSAVGSSLLISWGWSIAQIFILMGPLTAIAGFMICLHLNGPCCRVEG